MIGLGKPKESEVNAPDPSRLDRPILMAPIKDGLFVLPSKFTVEDEVKWAKRRQDSSRVAQYADSHCGLPNTFDQKGAYLCGGCKDGSSSPCNKLVIKTGECLIRIQTIDKPHLQSCGMWETKNAGDPEGRYCPKGKLDDARIGFGSTTNPLGFSCQRCEYGQGILPISDSEGRTRWCSLKGHSVEDNACCEDNEPYDKGEGNDRTRKT
jgi:hypothetical protein